VFREIWLFTGYASNDLVKSEQFFRRHAELKTQPNRARGHQRQKSVRFHGGG
jgi:hypothetical protein